jgi:hypothetical protein
MQECEFSAYHLWFQQAHRSFLVYCVQSENNVMVLDCDKKFDVGR